LVNEAIFPFNFETIRAYFRSNRSTEGYDGTPFDGTVVGPHVCSQRLGPGTTKDWVHKCRQPFTNETFERKGKQFVVTERNEAPLFTFDRTGWILQQLLKVRTPPYFHHCSM
jgi:hypothetical protein